MEASRPKKPSELTPAEKRDNKITSWGWGALGLLFVVNYEWHLSEETLAVVIAIVLLTVNFVRLINRRPINLLSLAIGVISIVHAVTHFIEVPFPFWPLMGGAVGLYIIGKLLLKDRIR